MGTTGRPVGVGELARLGLGGPGHAGELLVQAEEVLERHGGPGVVLLFDPDPLLRLDRLVEAVRTIAVPSRVRPVNSSMIFTSPWSTR